MPTTPRDPKRPARLKPLPDGSLELPLAPVRAEDGTRTERPPLVIPEPNMVELATIHDLVVTADDEMREKTGEPPEVPVDMLARVQAGELTAADQALLNERNKIMKERSRVAFSEASPHAKALLEVVRLLTGQELERADLPGWAGHWTVIGEVLTRFMDPFAGRGDELVAEAARAAGVMGSES